MRFRDLLPLSFRALLLNRGRSLLTMLGIIIGIASVILMISVGQAAQDYLLAQVASFGSDIVFVTSGRGDNSQAGPPSAAIKQVMTEKDFQKIRTQSWVSGVSAEVVILDLVSRNGVEKNTTISGASPDELPVYNMPMAEGRFLQDDDDASRRRVTVIGKNIAQQFFGEQDPIDQSIKIGKQSFRVIGVLGSVGTRFFTNVDDELYIPYTTAFDIYHKDRLNFLSIKVKDITPLEAEDRIRLVLRDTHNLSNPNGILSKDDFRVATQADAISRIGTIGTILQILLGSIASISLFVAGIGIMNIMYVTVTERTKEIGLRKAIGAREQDVLGQFLMEAILLTTVAGLIGVMMGLSLSWLGIQIISHFQSGWVFALPMNGILAAFGVSVAIGIVFGYLPARKAARLKPIESLRYE